MDVDELKFLLKLLGFPGHRALLSRLKPTPHTIAADRQKICSRLRDRGFVACLDEITSLKIAPPGKALLKLKLDRLPVTEDELTVLKASNQAAIAPKETGLPNADREAILQSLAQRGLIHIQTAVKEVWITEQGKTFLCQEYQPKGKSIITLDLLNNYLQLLRQPLVASSEEGLKFSKSPSKTHSLRSRVLDDTKILQMIQTLDYELGTENYLPLFHLRQTVQPPLSRHELDQILYRLQRKDQIELSSLQEAIAYTPEQVNAGIPQDIGGPLFFVSVNRQ